MKFILAIVLLAGLLGCSRERIDPSLEYLLKKPAVIVVTDDHGKIINVHVLDKIPQIKQIEFFKTKNRIFMAFGSMVDDRINGQRVAGSSIGVTFDIQDARLVGVSGNTFFAGKAISNEMLRQVDDFLSSPEKRHEPASSYFDCIKPKDIGPFVSADGACQIFRNIDPFLTFSQTSVETLGVADPIFFASRQLDNSPFRLIINVGIGADSNAPLTHLMIQICANDGTSSNAAEQCAMLAEKYIGAFLKESCSGGKRLFEETKDVFENSDMNVFGTQWITQNLPDCHIFYSIDRPNKNSKERSESFEITSNEMLDKLNARFLNRPPNPTQQP
jgi:hypothetical protein